MGISRRRFFVNGTTNGFYTGTPGPNKRINGKIATAFRGTF
jgi:hypothetical protein